ncbi:heteromeric transposase endonuclease subunit TnsA [Maridesulfovibrio zosterae]|uniref:heteromeric transposase endonuclease subunit TnsA n=1 Tax=Maridesulfovibrio zosterae TaxID=82171 RepID=UPI00041EDC17|nr:heteromeric transposase endonuclease subunit TnsA [Maridesulfovibrio zosterae]
MVKSKYSFDHRKLARFLKEGRGKGTGADYIPWLKVQDLSSRGRCSRITGWTTGRVHHLFSDLERDYFYHLEWADDVVDIREQFPLLPLNETVTLAEDSGIRHPMDTRSKVEIPLTTDFLITVKRAGEILTVARTVKPWRELQKKRTLEKFELERRYWLSKNVDWGIVTENEISTTVAHNVKSLHSLKNQGISEDSLEIQRALLIQVELQNFSTLSQMLEHIDSKFNRDSGTGLAIFKNLLAKKVICFDVTIRFDESSPLMAFSVRSEILGNELVI